MAKISFYTLNSRPSRRVSNPGNPIRYEYIEQFDRLGRPYLEVSKEVDLEELINANAECCKISNIINRFVHGDTSALNYRPVTFADVADMPTSLIDAYNTVQATKAKFDAFEKEIKAKYNNSFGEFLASLDKQNIELKESDVNE